MSEDGISRRRSHWGWGYEDAMFSASEIDAIGAVLSARLGVALERRDPVPIADVQLPEPRVHPPAPLASICTVEPSERARHSYGRSYRDAVRGARGEYPHPPDLVAYPRDENDVASLLDWCASARLAAVPYGGGSSVVGGVETGGDWTQGYAGVLTIDLAHLDAVIEVDRTSRAARVQAGVLGPALEDRLRPQGLTIRHFPQSFECSSLGGWIATRAGGHFATGPTHIDDLVESVRVVTPSGISETRRLPGSGAGPQPDRLWIGSEGTLGIITEAWVRLQDRPRWRASLDALCTTFEAGAQCVRLLAQSGLQPANCRLLDPLEAIVNGAGDGTHALLIVAFESADHPMDAWLSRAKEICREAGAEVPEDRVRSRDDGPPGSGTSHGSGRPATGGGAGGAEAWRSAFIRAPYIRDALVQLGVIVETFETAVTWNRFGELHAAATEAATAAIRKASGGAGWVTCRFTHAYPDGPAPYFSVLAAGRRGAELEQWAEIKAAASDALGAAGGTITHHHAVGRDHRPWYDRERPELFAKVLTEAKRALDPAWVLNPGVLIDVPEKLQGRTQAGER